MRGIPRSFSIKTVVPILCLGDEKSIEMIIDGYRLQLIKMSVNSPPPISKQPAMHKSSAKDNMLTLNNTPKRVELIRVG